MSSRIRNRLGPKSAQKKLPLLALDLSGEVGLRHVGCGFAQKGTLCPDRFESPLPAFFRACVCDCEWHEIGLPTTASTLSSTVLHAGPRRFVRIRRLRTGNRFRPVATLQP